MFHYVQKLVGKNDPGFPHAYDCFPTKITANKSLLNNYLITQNNRKRKLIINYIITQNNRKQKLIKQLFNHTK